MTTTIKVSDELRDRLKAQAARDGLTLGAHLAQLADADDRRHRLLALKRAVAETSTESLENYAAESDAWEQTQLTDATA
jgi:mRNA interferase MazF